jgi:hypothetical protein
MTPDSWALLRVPKRVLGYELDLSILPWVFETILSVCCDSSVGMAVLGRSKDASWLTGRTAVYLFTLTDTRVLWFCRKEAHVSKKLAMRGSALFLACRNKIVRLTVARGARAPEQRQCPQDEFVLPVRVRDNVVDFAFLSEAQLLVVTRTELWLLELEFELDLDRTRWSLLSSELVGRAPRRGCALCARVRFMSVAVHESQEGTRALVLRSDGKIDVWE